MIKLEENEVILFQEDDVSVATLDQKKSFHNNILYMTNQRIAYQRKPSLLGKQFPYNAYSLNEIKVYCGVPQVKQGTFPGIDADKSLDLYFNNGAFLQFHFDYANDSKILKWIFQICEALDWTPTSENLNKLKKRSHLETVGKNSASTKGKKQTRICPECEKMLQEDAVFCAYCGIQLPKLDKKPDKKELISLICPKCGKEHSSNLIFCTECGAKIK